MQKDDFNFSKEITFKSIFRNKKCFLEELENILFENKIKGKTNKKESLNGKFCSYSISAIFPSEEVLQKICHQVSSLEFFMTMF